MPELPEVEVTRRALAPHVEGLTVRAVRVRERRLRWPVPAQLARWLAGRPLLRLDRRGKYLLWRFAHGTLISHLGMSGSWRLHLTAPPAPGAHDHADLVFAAGRTVRVARLTDPRRFGALLWHPHARGDVERHALLAGLGREPLDPRFDGAYLYAATRGRRAPIKQVLLAGDIVVGVGNIYASESLFRAGIDPRRPAHRLGRARCARLAEAIRAVLAEAIEAGGATLRDFIGADGRAGYFMMDARVYDRAGLPCRACGTTIRRIVQGQRATYYCPRCQR
ncbi:MAG TPA: bifunctional DNA-formamidopyrimidine glycosylase/DNA-(apurinic or apyrimidinic site) lyase [Burkholderiaceae bacterium]|jgi:formamidopyrimidine-DNA glycosylase|nr:bifunctional DNA-formamidopyrimidine glycosylase/DNA-(apurinic or apyrimidinic site) lyase [Burkholderiaceae bacterium]